MPERKTMTVRRRLLLEIEATDMETLDQVVKIVQRTLRRKKTIPSRFDGRIRTSMRAGQTDYKRSICVSLECIGATHDCYDGFLGVGINPFARNYT